MPRAHQLIEEICDEYIRKNRTLIRDTIARDGTASKASPIEPILIVHSYVVRSTDKPRLQVML